MAKKKVTKKAAKKKPSAKNAAPKKKKSATQSPTAKKASAAGVKDGQGAAKAAPVGKPHVMAAAAHAGHSCDAAGVNALRKATSEVVGGVRKINLQGHNDRVRHLLLCATHGAFDPDNQSNFDATLDHSTLAGFANLVNIYYSDVGLVGMPPGELEVDSVDEFAQAIWDRIPGSHKG